jgi:flagellar basal-body rod modification protein FlgD
MTVQPTGYAASPSATAYANAASSSDGTDSLDPSGTGSSFGITSDDFMKMFLAQLSNQDPSNPVDNSQFLDQMAQMTMVSTLQSVQKSLSGSQLAQTSSMIGKNVTGLDTSGNAVNGVVDRVIQSSDAGIVLMVGSQAIQPDSVETVTDVTASGTATIGA